MGYRHPAGETVVDPLHRLGSQGDFRHQEQGLPAVGNRPGDGPQVHFGLAAAGNAVQQEGAGLLSGIFLRLNNGIQGIGLRGGKLQRRFRPTCLILVRPRQERGLYDSAFLPHPLQGQETLLHQGVPDTGTKIPVGLGG